MDPQVSPTVRRLVGVYDADGTWRGELSYWVKARLGRAHCALCDITHGSVRAKPQWTACRADLGVPFDTYHRDDQPDQARTAHGGALPAVVAELDDGTYRVLLDADDLEGCAGSVDTLLGMVGDRLTAAGLSLGPS